MTVDRYLTLGDELQRGRYDEKNLAIVFIQTQRKYYTKDTFNTIGNWFDYGINNWATTDVLCMFAFSGFLIDKVIDLDDLNSWNDIIEVKGDQLRCPVCDKIRFYLLKKGDF
jgi:hypothetical protein